MTGRAVRHAARRAISIATWLALAALSRPTGAARSSAPDMAGLRDLPLVEVAPARGGDARAGDVLAVFMTGDGGWAPLDRHVAAVLAEHGVAVVGLDSRAYLSTPRTPERTAADVARIARRYMALWHRTRLAVVGYSRGADAAPFVATRLPADLSARLTLVGMLAPATTASFSFHWIDLVRDSHGPDDRPVVPEMERIRGVEILCVYGTEERDSACRSAPPGLARSVALEGGHHLGGDYRELGLLVLEALAAG